MTLTHVVCLSVVVVGSSMRATVALSMPVVRPIARSDWPCWCRAVRVLRMVVSFSVVVGGGVGLVAWVVQSPSGVCDGRVQVG